jgi:hypothetical protein
MLRLVRKLLPAALVIVLASSSLPLPAASAGVAGAGGGKPAARTAACGMSCCRRGAPAPTCGGRAAAPLRWSSCGGGPAAAQAQLIQLPPSVLASGVVLPAPVPCRRLGAGRWLRADDPHRDLFDPPPRG